MNFNEEREVKHHEKIWNIIKNLGFKEVGWQYGMFKHPLIPDINFDFSATSLDGIPKAIFNLGKEMGKQ